MTTSSIIKQWLLDIMCCFHSSVDSVYDQKVVVHMKQSYKPLQTLNTGQCVKWIRRGINFKASSHNASISICECDGTYVTLYTTLQHICLCVNTHANSCIPHITWPFSASYHAAEMAASEFTTEARWEIDVCYGLFLLFPFFKAPSLKSGFDRDHMDVV